MRDSLNQIHPKDYPGFFRRNLRAREKSINVTHFQPGIPEDPPTPVPSQGGGAPNQRLLHWLRTTSPATVGDEAERHLAHGVDEKALWTTCVLAANVHLNNRLRDGSGQASRALIGAHIAYELAAGQPGHIRHQLLRQALQQTVCDLHNPYFSPYELLPFWPHHEEHVEETVALLHHTLEAGNAMGADHCFMGLAHKLPRAKLMDLLLTLALQSLAEDAQAFYLLSTAIFSNAYTTWPQRLTQLRWVVRYSSGAPRTTAAYQQAVKLAQTYRVEHGAPCTTLQPEFIEPVCAALSIAANDGPELVAQAMSGDQIAPQTILAAAVRVAGQHVLSHAADTPHGRWEEALATAIDTSILLSTLHRMLPHMSPSNGAIAAIFAGDLLRQLMGEQRISPRGRAREHRASHRYRPYGCPPQHRADPGYLLAQVRSALSQQDHCIAAAATQAYIDAGGRPKPLIALLIEVASAAPRPQSGLHLEAMLWEFYNSGPQNTRKGEYGKEDGFLVQAAYVLAHRVG